MSRGTLIAAIATSVLVGLGASSARAGDIAPALASELTAHAASDMIPIYVQMRQTPDYTAIDQQANAMHRKDRQRFMVAQARAQAMRFDDGITGQLNALQASGDVRSVSNLWIAGAFSLDATPAAIHLLASRNDVLVVDTDRPVMMLDTSEKTPLGAQQGVPPVTPASQTPKPGTRADAWGIDYINAPTVWSEGYTGQGVLVAHLDTGIWYLHPDLANRIWVNDDPWNGIDDDGNGYIDDLNGYNFNAHSRDPLDDHGHGTHTSGTVCGDGTGGTHTGVAPGAHIMACKILDSTGNGRPADLVEAVQYAVANGADVITGSIGWFEPDTPTRQMYRTACEGARVAGVVMTIACGNERSGYTPPSGGLPRTPGDVPAPWRHPDQPAIGAIGGVITIGATSYHADTYAWFSSYGPSKWTGISPWNDYTTSPYLIKPDVCAPGEDVNSTILGGGYSGDTWSGTSMATPHVAGMAALMLSKNPDLLPAGVDSIMEKNCLALGVAGKDDDYGSGRIQAPQIIAAVPEPGPDLIAPAAVSNLATAPAPGFGKVKLLWTAPGDDGTVGTATAYDIRYHKGTFGPIDEAGWAAATKVTVGVPAPAVAGTPQNMLVGQLQLGHNYYFAMKTVDDAGNWSSISNSPLGTASGHASPAGSVGGVTSIIPSGHQVTAEGQVTLRDAAGTPVSGATITVQWSGLVSGEVSATTDAEGSATFASPAASASAHGVFQFTVISVSGGSADLGIGVGGEMAYGIGQPALGGFALAPELSQVGSHGSAIDFSLPSAGSISLRVYSVTGSLVRVLASGAFTAGAHQVTWDGRDQRGQTAANGVYYVRLTKDNESLSRKLVVVQ